jgi:hypothetical protein
MNTNKLLNSVAAGAIALYLVVVATETYDGSILQDKIHSGTEKLKKAFSSKD